MSRPAVTTAWPPDPPASPAGTDTVAFTVSPHVTPFLDGDGPAALRSLAADLAPAGARVLKLTASLCPDCLAGGEYDHMTVPMVVVEVDDQVRVRSRCDRHGTQTDVRWRDAAMYHRARDLDAASRTPALRPDDDGDDAATGTGTATGIGNVVVTNRCDRSCHYCFYYANSGEPLYEPSKATIESMVARLGAREGIGAVQLTGGEPTVREDIAEIVGIADEYADEVLLNSHGGRFLHEPDLARRVSEAGARGLYTSFDGVDPSCNAKNYWEFPHALSACHDTGMCAMLVPTVVRGWNDHQLGDLVRFGAANADTVCGVNFQPVSVIGRVDGEKRRRQRITVSDVIERIETQTDGAVPAEAWLPLPVYRTISAFKRQWTGEHLYGVTGNFSSWMVTAVAVDGDEIYPLTDLVDVEHLLHELVALAEEVGATPGRLGKLRVARRLLGNFDALLGDDPRGLADRLRAIAVESARTRSFDGIDDLYDNLLPVGVRHFQDPYTYDMDAVSECDVQYATPDGEVVPFNVYNVVPELYRDRLKREHAITVEEWLDRDYATTEPADDPRSTERSADVIDADGESEGVYGADLTAARRYDDDHRETVEAAYHASIADLDPVWSVTGEVVDAPTGGCGSDCC